MSNCSTRHLVSLATFVLLPTIACSSEPEPDIWSVHITDMQLTSQPTITAAADVVDGGASDGGSAPGTGAAGTAVKFTGAYLIAMHISGDTTTTMDLVTPGSSGSPGFPGHGWLQLRIPVDTVAPRTFSVRAGGTDESDANRSPTDSEASVMYVTSDGVEASSATGQLIIQTHRITRAATARDGTATLNGQFSNVQFSMPDGRKFIANGGFAASGSSVPASSSSGGTSSGGTSSGGTSSGGTSSSCSKAWTCANDGQATPMCQAACVYTGTQRQQTCQLLLKMTSQGAKCCTAC